MFGFYAALLISDLEGWWIGEFVFWCHEQVIGLEKLKDAFWDKVENWNPFSKSIFCDSNESLVSQYLPQSPA